MWRWIMAAIAMAGFVLAFTTHSPGWLGVGLVLGFGGIVGVVLSMAAARVAASARPESTMASPQDLAALQRVHRPGPPEAKATAAPRPATRDRPPPD